MIGVKTYKNLNNCSGQYWYNIEIKTLTEKLIETKTEMNFKTEISLHWSEVAPLCDFYINVISCSCSLNLLKI